MLTNIIAQTKEITFNHISLEDGLSQSVILDVVQDSSGFLWIATQDGLNRYDGQEFKIFKNLPEDTNSISGNWINTLSIGNDSTLWIGTFRNGFGKFNTKTHKFKRFILDTAKNKKKYAIGKIIPFNNYLFVSTYGNGLYQINLYNNQIKHFQHNPKNSTSIEANFVRSMILSKNKFLWIGTTKGLDKFEIEKGKFIHYFSEESKQKLFENFIITLLEDSNNKLWIGTRKGLNIFDPETKQLYKYSSSSKKNSLKDKTIIDLFEDSYKFVWIGTWKGGLNKTINKISSHNFDYSDIKFNYYTKQDYEPNSISGNYVRKIYEDRSKNLWVGTWGSSLNKINLKPKKFHTITGNKNKPIHTSHSFVRCFTLDNQNRLWVGTAGAGVDIFDSSFTKSIRHSFVNNFQKNLGRDRVYSLFTDSNGDVWIGLGDGLVKWNAKKNKFYNIPIKKYLPEIKENILVNSIVEFNGYFIFSTSSGLLLFRKANQKFYKLTFTDNRYKIPKKEISYLLKEDENNLLVGTNKSFVFKLKLKNNNSTLPEVISIISYQDKIPKNYFGSKRVNFMLKDNKGFIWFATSKGLYRFDKQMNSVRIFLEKDGLPNEIIYSVLQDNLGNIWVSTNKGISKIYLKNKKYVLKNFDVTDGLQGNEFNQASCYKTAEGTLYFGGINGFSYFNPAELKENIFTPNSVITNIKIFNKEIPDLQKVLSNKNFIVNYSDKMLTFTFAALEFTNPTKNNFAYKLQGFDKIWINSKHERRATYTNLNPGKYKLLIKTSNDDNIWGKEVAALNLIVKPPFWMTWWFLLLVISSIILLAFLIHKYRVERLLEMERLRIKIASDLHDEIGPLLTQISLTADSINYDSDIKKIKKRSSSIRNRSREMIALLSDVIWSIDARKDKFENLLDRMQDFTNSLADENEIKFVINKNISEMNKILKVDFRQNIFLIFKETINNSVKHSGCTQIIIDINYQNKEFTMKIMDNGKGMNINEVYKGNGIKNIKMRAKNINANIEFISKNGLTIFLKTNYV